MKVTVNSTHTSSRPWINGCSIHVRIRFTRCRNVARVHDSERDRCPVHRVRAPLLAELLEVPVYRALDKTTGRYRRMQPMPGLYVGPRPGRRTTRAATASKRWALSRNGPVFVFTEPPVIRKNAILAKPAVQWRRRPLDERRSSLE